MLAEPVERATTDFGARNVRSKPGDLALALGEPAASPVAGSRAVEDRAERIGLDLARQAERLEAPAPSQRPGASPRPR